MGKINVRKYLHFEEEKNDCFEYCLNPEKQTEILEVFTLYANDDDNLIDVKHISTAFRALGQHLTICEELDIVSQFAQEQLEKINYITFYKLVQQRWKIFDKDALIESFRQLDKEENRYVNVKELKKLLTTIGEPLSPEQVNEWLKDGKPFIRKKRLYYEDFVTLMHSK